MVASVDEIRRSLGALETRSDGEVGALVAQTVRLAPDDARDALQLAVPVILDPYLTAAGEIGATWYEDLRSASSESGRFTARTPDLPAAERIDTLVRWSVSPLYGQSDSTVLSLLTGGVQRLIASAARDAVEMNGERDRAAVGFARIPRPGCCAFCGLMASRGPVYSSAQAAGRVVGRGSDVSTNFREDGTRRAGGQALGVRSRGTQSIGNTYHDRCHCVVTPVFQGGDPTIAQVVRATESKYLEQYRQVVGTSTSAYSLRNPDGAQFESTNLAKTLANWRAEFGTS